MAEKNPTNKWYDGQKVTLEDLRLEQTFNTNNVAFTNDAILGSGVLLDHPQEPIVFDSDALTSAQQGFVAVSTFDGRGILDSAYASTDLDEGDQVAVELTDARVDGTITMVCTIIGKLFDNTLTYEHLTFTNNGVRITRNHYKEVTNVMFQNLLGNSNTFVDGIGSFNTIGTIADGTGGRVLVTEASSYKVSNDSIVAEQILEPDIIFRDYKVYDPGKSLQIVLGEAVGASNDVDDLDVNTTVASTRDFTEGASTETIYAQKFQMKGDSIQKISLLLGLKDDITWSGTLVVGIRPLLTSTNCPTDFLPDNDIEFDPDAVPIEEISLTSAQLADLGIVLDLDSQEVDFVFTDSLISNPALSGLVDGDYYVITVRRTGSSAIGTVFLDEARNSSTTTQRLVVFSGNAWTDVPNSTLWYRVWDNSVKVASGVAYDEGVRLPITKVEQGLDGVIAQNFVEDITIVNSGENAENYLIVKKNLEFSEPETHPRTGDDQVSQQEDAPEFRVLEQDELVTLLVAESKTVPLARIRDQNPRSNPAITGTIDYPGLALGNTIHIVNPPTDLLTQNVVGSTIIPDTLNPTIKYRIISQETFVDLYGDVDGDGDLDVFDGARMEVIDGYQVFLSTTTRVNTVDQVAAILAGTVDMLEILRADIDSTDGYEVSISDIIALDNFLVNGTAFPNGQSSFTRVTLEVEPILDPKFSYTPSAISTINLEIDNPDLIDPTKFSLSTNIGFGITFVPTWFEESVDILDLRRFVSTTFLDFNAADIQQQPENGGLNSMFVPGDLFLQANVKNLDGTFHRLDLESNTIEIELPPGNTEGELNIFEEYVAGRMNFSDGTLVSTSGINNNQVKFEVCIGSHVKNVSDGNDGYIDFDGYNDGYGANADEAIGTYIDHTTGLLRIRAFNIIRNLFFPELRTRILVTVNLKKAGFRNEPVLIGPEELVTKLRVFAP